MSEHLGKQAQLQRSIERYLDNFKKIEKGNLTPAKVRSRIQSLKELWASFFDGHADLLHRIPESSRAALSYFQDNAFDTTLAAYQHALNYMTECLEELEPVVSPNPIFSTLPKTVLDSIKPIYENLSNDKLLERCVGGYTQNSNESFNQLIWKIAPKTMHSGAKIVNIAAFLATCTFNNGVTSLLEVMNVLGISVGSGAHLYAAQEDETRIAKAELQAQEQTKEGRIRRRQQNLANMNIPLTAEDLHYGAGIDDSI
ncbi:uncharacterized protein LOC143905880 [Temnothorax americanus]|uniref:uncharacterized protein LOC143905880 n=1 Tax=Temnothorax americanus TaxID=1964332 RepID=UPI004069259D